MSRFPLFAALSLIAVPTLAQDPPAPAAADEPGNAIEAAAEAFGTCVSAGVAGVGETVTPEAGAASVLAGCATQRQALEAAIQALIATLPADQQAEARAELSADLGGIEPDIASAIRQQREAGATGASATAAAEHPAE